jgi:hypothetical protein
MYIITNYSKQKARELGVEIKPSTNPKKKIDVYKNQIKIATIGDIKYKDFPTYMKENPEIANQRRILYHKRHAKEKGVVGSPGYYALNILW